MKKILNENCTVIYFWYDHLVLRDNGDAEIVTKAINEGDFKTFQRIKAKYPNEIYYNEKLKQQYDIIFFPDTATIFYDNDIIGNIDITTELGFSFITDSEYECG